MTETDYLIIGGGSAGATLAGRLSEDPAQQVTLLEAGGKGDSWVVKIPAGIIALLPYKLNNWGFETVPQAGLNGRKGYQPRGKALGGSSAINAMIYIRGHRSDYDHWASLGNSGWGYEDVLPFFKRAENNSRIHDAYHGQGGPLSVTDVQSDNPFSERFLEAARQSQLPITDDFNGDHQEGVGRFQVTNVNGERCSAARAYLHPHMGKRPNLRVETKAHATRILFEGKRAVGVEYRQGGNTRIIRARKEVVLSAGAFQSPQLLLLSGVGPGEALQRLGVPVVHDLPGVGKKPAGSYRCHPDLSLQKSGYGRHFIGLRTDPAQSD